MRVAIPAAANTLPQTEELQLAETSFRDKPNIGSQTIHTRAPPLSRTTPILWTNRNPFRFSTMTNASMFPKWPYRSATTQLCECQHSCFYGVTCKSSKTMMFSPLILGSRRSFWKAFVLEGIRFGKFLCFPPRACAVKMHMDISQEPFCAEIYEENAGR